jgi:hypothetical protein
MTKMLTVVALSLLAGGSALAGDVTMGRSMGSPKMCHVTHFVGPSDMLESYERQTRERFQQPDIVVEEQIRTHVVVAVIMEDMSGHSCLSTDIPQRIVIADKQDVPVVTIELQPQQVILGNRLGARFEAWNGRAQVPTSEIQKLVGREYTCAIIFSHHVERERWKKDWAEKLLR